MHNIWKSKKEKLHTRSIEITTYDYDGQRLIIEGFLKDERFQDSHLVSGENFPAGVIHHMGIRLLINCSSLVIEDIDVDLISVPRKVCLETLESLAPIKGLTVTRGFTSKVKKIAGGVRGCTHLVELLLAMAPAVVQGFAAYRSQKTASFDHEETRMIGNFLINTCHAWREDGPFAKRLKEMLDPEQETKTQ